jgi:hypothetical protein
MKLAALCFTAFVATTAVAADPSPQQPADPCKSGLPWVLPKVEGGFDVSEQYLLSGATTPVQITVCHCTPKTPGKPTPHVWVNVTKKVEQEKQQDGGNAVAANGLPSLKELEKAWKDAKGKTQFEFLGRTGNTVVVSRLSTPACMTVVGLSVLVMHSDTEEDRWGTSQAK